MYLWCNKMKTTKTVTVCFVAFLASVGQLPAQTANYFTTLTNLMYTDAALARDFFDSLGEEEILTLCSQAFEHGWDSYVIGAGILQPTLGKRWEKEPPGYREAVRIVTNTNYHPGMRYELAGYFFTRAGGWKHEEIYEYMDLLRDLLFTKDARIEYRQGLAEDVAFGLWFLIRDSVGGNEITESVRRHISRIAYWARDIQESALQRVEDENVPVQEKTACIYIICHMLAHAGGADRAIEKATGDDSLRQTMSQARQVLVRVLLQKKYPPEIRKTVVGLNSVHGCELGALLTVKDVERLASDEAFKGREEDIERLRQKVATRIRTRDH